MEQVCPLCNGLQQLRARCDRCGAQMVDGGKVTDYLDDYAPYWNTPYDMQENEAGRCTHVLFCPGCSNESYAIVQSELF
jgi:hypothetical protein